MPNIFWRSVRLKPSEMVANVLGYITEKDAVDQGLTHSGSYFGIPVWMAPDHPDLLVCAKWRPMDFAMTVFHHIEGVMRPILFPDDEPVFQFKVGKRIESKGALKRP